MAADEAPPEFPDVSQKLAAPKKLSAFEKERQEKEEKRKRAEQENAAALREFQESFGDDDDPLSHFTGGRGPRSGPPQGYGTGSARYGMQPPGQRSGPGSLGPVPGPPPSMKRKRALDEMREAQQARREQGLLGYEDETHVQPVGDAMQEDDREIEDPKPTLHLSNLPPNMSSETIMTMLARHVKVHNVRLLPHAAPGQAASRRSTSAIATLMSEVTEGQIDNAVGTLRDKYLGCGHYLSISRHLSSTALHPSMYHNQPSMSREPFDAQPARMNQGRGFLRNAPPPMEQRRGAFAPPSQYDRRQPGPRVDTNLLVRPPLELAIIKAVHTVAEHILSEPDAARAMKKEAMLMAIPEVQRDERFAFLFDSRSPAGVYYRFLLWSPDSPEQYTQHRKQLAQDPEMVFKDISMEWIPAQREVSFPNLSALQNAIHDADYVSSEEESGDEDGGRKFNSGRESDNSATLDQRRYMTPLQRARLISLLSRLPTTNTKLRKGDVARVTNFVINHAGGGAEEMVDILLLNVDRPFSRLSSASYERADSANGQQDDEYEPDDQLPTFENNHNPQQDLDGTSKREDDPSNAKLIALYIISDILSASSTAGARNAWKYRQLFEAGFETLRTFERIGRLDRELGWGRLKSEQWKRKIGVIFGIWENWSVFSSEVMDRLKKSFFEPPVTEAERVAQEMEAANEKKEQEAKWMSKFKKVGTPSSNSASPAPAPLDDDSPLNDIDGAPMDDIDGAPMDQDVAEMPTADVGNVQHLEAAPKPHVPKRRMRAEDMFADSDVE